MIQLAPNVVIAGRFRLNRLLGKGGMGSVWHATHLGLDIPCAVKFIEGEYAQIPEAQQRFEREAKAAAQLRSPHVVQILDHGISDGTPYIAMELLDGEDLGKRMTRVGRMATDEINIVMTQVCRALAKAHAAGVVHRDLKPDNIFLVQDDDREIAKVLDFGIAKSNINALDGSNTKTGAMLGTPYYMSPEQAQGIRSVDFRADLWSLAVIVFQAVTGRLPFESEALGDLLVKIIVSPIPVPSQVAPDVPQSFDRWWAKASARDPGLRFQSAKEFADSLSSVFGYSQMTDMMDRGAFRGPMQSGSGEHNVHPHMLTPSGYGPQPGTPQPNMPFTPNPGVPFTPHPGMGQTPPPNQYARQHGGGTVPMQAVQFPPSNLGQRPHGTTSATFAGSEVTPDAVPKKKNGLALVLGGVAFLAMAAAAAIIVIAMRTTPGTAAGTTTNAPTTTTAEPSVTGSATASATPSVTATAPATAATTAEPTATATAEPAPSTTATTTATTATTTATGPIVQRPPLGQPTIQPTVPRPVPTTTSTGTKPPPKRPDLGF